ncbi:MAG: hypothetical protein GF364_15660, partial [Candidatus Lokiarchaeota archaeon]|nr:hypothetical protein [Candidatus Lokiarchaeota archaeon]
MESRERVLKAFNHEEPDRVPLFCQSVMPEFNQHLMDRWEDDIGEDDIFFLGGRDFTMLKKLGFDSAWGGGGIGVWYPKEVLEENPLPKPKLGQNEHLNMDGKIIKTATLNKHKQTWYVKPYLTTEEKADNWYDNYFNVEWQFQDNSVDFVNQHIEMMNMNEFVPTCGLQSILEPIWEGLGLALLAKLIRKKREKLKRYIELRTKRAVIHSKLAAQTDYDVYNICDDTAFKHNTIINPKIHRELVIPAYKEIIKPIRDAGKKVFFHSDGFTEPYFDGL